MKKLTEYFREMSDDDLRKVYKEISTFYYDTGDMRQAFLLKQVRKQVETDMPRYDYPITILCQAAFEEIARRWFENKVSAGTDDDGCIAYQKTTDVTIEEK